MKARFIPFFLLVLEFLAYSIRGVENNYNCIVMDLLGHSLEDLFNICQRRFSLKVLFFKKKQLIGGGGINLFVMIFSLGDIISHLDHFNEAMLPGRGFGAITRSNENLLSTRHFIPLGLF